jgi:hypothetical protein
MFDITFISYNEPNADSNWAKLKERFPIARRVHGVKGIHNAHIAAANKCRTKMFWVVDGDSEILDSFDFRDPTGLWKPDESVYVYQSQNPINGLTYGYGGIKLLPRDRTINMNTKTIDMTTSIGNYFTAVEQVASLTNFNTDPFSTWKSAFRECVKLSSKVIDGQVDQETEERLNVWCTVKLDSAYGDYCIRGARTGREYGTANAGNADALRLINNFDWLQQQFDTLDE